ncbi:receptor like protein 30-like [Herrania umbratica]|uniref:Receptor like protein 30-like n=1 Tax=Herrania umbratica TaxID=108875 RepID=A0A6J1AQ62_9ROSI|nr:receptor like protein 30-like [Herrania umbratica]
MGSLIGSLQVLCLLLVLVLPFEVDCSLSFSSSALNYSTPLCQPEDSSALLQFKNTISIHDSDDPICADSMTSYPKTKTWNESTNCCSWEGVTCDEVTGHVIGLDLSCSSLVGSLPANSSLFLLKGLKRLNLAHNNFNGSSIPSGGQLPSTLMNLTQLSQLRFSFNKLEGPLPSHVSGLQNLKEFQSFSNLLSGGIPSWLFTLPSLEFLGLSYNRLTGPIDPIQNPSSVQEVYLASNGIHGEMPRSFFDLANLTHLDLSSNNLSGVIKPDLLSKLENLQMLDLSSNNFSGLIEPELISKLKNLRRLHLSNNKLLSLSSGTGIKDTFPELMTLSFSSCNVSRFPGFLRTGKNLRVLDLSDNKISGSVLKWELEGWEQLTFLNLSYNFLTSLEQFPGKNLEILDLRSNLLQGPLLAPPPSLQQFFISNNKLTGKIPPLICNLSSLEILDLSRNNLGGTIPACLGNFSYLLSTINLQMNNFHGKIPDSFVVGNSLTYLLLSDNQFEGLLPRSLVNCFLRILDLANNKLRDTFPHWLDANFSLKVLVLRSNRFHGPLNNSIVKPSFMSLQLIDLSQNEFSGLLPSNFFQNLFAMKYTRPVSPTGVHITSFPEGIGSLDDSSVNVTTKRLELELELARTLLIFFAIDFSSNQFYGKIPEVIGELSSVQVLNLSHNSLTGHIPTSLGNLVALESLDLSSNKLDGRIPSQLTNLTFLEVLDLSKNNLVGPIPNGKQFSTFENDSYSGNLGLCGFPLSKQCGNNEGSKSPAPKFKEDEGSALAFIWKLVVMGYGCGLVLGLSTGYIVFTTGRPWWFVRMVERNWQNNVTKWIRRKKRRRN